MSTPVTFTARVDAYLDYRRQAGFALKIEGEQLARFARFADHISPGGARSCSWLTQWACASGRPGRSPLPAVWNSCAPSPLLPTVRSGHLKISPWALWTRPPSSDATCFY